VVASLKQLWWQNQSYICQNESTTMKLVPLSLKVKSNSNKVHAWFFYIISFTCITRHGRREAIIANFVTIIVSNLQPQFRVFTSTMVGDMVGLILSP
jgi:hypothetical protein